MTNEQYSAAVEALSIMSLQFYSRADLENALANLHGLTAQEFAECKSFGDIIELVRHFGADTVLNYLEGSI